MGHIRVAGYNENFTELYNSQKRKTIIYGLGDGYKLYKNHLPKPDMICDKRAAEIGTIDGVQVSLPEKMEKINEPFYIVVTVIGINAFEEICDYLKVMDIEATVFHASNNVGIQCDSFWGTINTFQIDNSLANKRVRINLVCDDSGWILNKFATRMESCLKEANVDVVISDQSREDVDLNHHIQFASFKAYSNDTLMISHVDCQRLFDHLNKQLQTARLGICMSRDTMEKLVQWGIKRDKLCFINPAHDGVIRPRKRVIGITHKTHEFDLRKRISALYEMLDGINPNFFKFVIMGAGWENVIKKLNDMGFETEYYPGFDMETYLSIVPAFDYYLFTGFDEGSMGYLDAVAAGVKTIVTPQGFHLDNAHPIDYPCRTVSQFNESFKSIQNEIVSRVKSVEDWTWERYTNKHLALWEYILHRKSLTDLYTDQLKYEDGIYSMMLYDNRIPLTQNNETR